MAFRLIDYFFQNRFSIKRSFDKNTIGQMTFSVQWTFGQTVFSQIVFGQPTFRWKGVWSKNSVKWFFGKMIQNPNDHLNKCSYGQKRRWTVFRLNVLSVQKFLSGKWCSAIKETHICVNWRRNFLVVYSIFELWLKKFIHERRF
jgi:hypothetical protein